MAVSLPDNTVYEDRNAVTPYPLNLATVFHLLYSLHVGGTLQLAYGGQRR